MHHRGARAGGTDDEFGIALFAQLDEALGNPSSLHLISGVESRLPTASLPLIKFDFATGATQHFDGARADAGPHLVDDAGYKQPDFDCRITMADIGHCQFAIAITKLCVNSGCLTGLSIYRTKPREYIAIGSGQSQISNIW